MNDLVRSELTTLMNDPRLSKADGRCALQAHQQAIRDTEIQLTCASFDPSQSDVQAYQSKYDGDADKSQDMVAWARIVAKLSAIAVNCGISRLRPPQHGPAAGHQHLQHRQRGQRRTPAGSGASTRA